MKTFIVAGILAVFCSIQADASAVNDFVDAVLLELSKSTKERGPAPISLGGALKQDCLLYDMGLFVLQEEPTCTDISDDVVQVDFKLKYPKLTLTCSSKKDDGPGTAEKLSPDNITLTTENSLFQVKTTVKYRAVDKSDTVYTFISKENESYKIDDKYKGTQTEQNVPKIYFGMIDKDVQAFMPSSYIYTYQVLAFSDKKNLFLKKCPK